MSCWKELADLARMEVLLDDVTMSLVVLLVVVSLLVVVDDEASERGFELLAWFP